MSLNLIAKTLQVADITEAKEKRTVLLLLLYLQDAGYYLKNTESLSLVTTKNETKNKFLKLRQKIYYTFFSIVLWYTQNFIGNATSIRLLSQTHVYDKLVQPPFRERGYIFTFYSKGKNLKIRFLQSFFGGKKLLSSLSAPEWLVFLQIKWQFQRPLNQNLEL